MKLRWRKRPSATVLHFSVLMTLGSALPLAISSSRPVLSMGARHPVRAVFATAWVIYLGYPKVKILHGGYVAWTAAGMPTSTAVTTPQAKSFPLDLGAAGILVDLQSMKAAVADPNIVKLDTRDVDEWIADSSSP